jgi:hypothetical protein
VKSALLLGEEPDPALVNEVVVDGYAPDLDDSELFELGRDPFLIAYAYTARENRAVVTGEVSKPSRRRARKRVPDVCATLGVRCRDLVALINELDFRIR